MDKIDEKKIKLEVLKWQIDRLYKKYREETDFDKEQLIMDKIYVLEAIEFDLMFNRSKKGFD